MIEKLCPESSQPPTTAPPPQLKPVVPRDTWFDDLRRNYAEATRSFYQRLKEDQAYEGDDWGDPDEDDWGSA
jgi:hypothetical protein